MKVIKKGDGRKGWSKQVKCTGKGNKGAGCGATLQVEQGDLFYTQSSARDETDYYITFVCCECGCLTDIETPLRPQSLPNWREWGRAHGIRILLDLGSSQPATAQERDY